MALRRVLYVVFLLTILFIGINAAKGSENDSRPANTTSTTTSASASSTSGASRRSVEPNVYEDSVRFCRYFVDDDRVNAESELGASSTSDQDLAEAYAAGYQKEYQQEAMDACLNGLKED